MKRTRMRRQGPRGRRRQAALAKLRPIILARAKGCCEVPWCKKKTRLDLHHVKKRGQGGADTEENVVALCRPHHDQTDNSEHSGRLIISYFERKSPFLESHTHGFQFLILRCKFGVEFAAIALIPRQPVAVDNLSSATCGARRS